MPIVDPFAKANGIVDPFQKGIVDPFVGSAQIPGQSQELQQAAPPGEEPGLFPVKKGEPIQNEFAKGLLGGAENALAQTTGLGAMGLGLATAGLNILIPGRAKYAKSEYENIANALTYQPRTEVGKEDAKRTGEVINQLLLPLTGIHMPTALSQPIPKGTPKSTVVDAATFKRNLQTSEVPKINIPEATPKLLETSPGELPAAYGYQENTPMSPSQLKDWVNTQEKFKQYAEGTSEQQRYAAAQAAIEARQKALEFEVAKQGKSDFNAAERARQEAAPTGYEQWVEAQRQAAEQRQPGDNTPVDFKRPLAGRQNVETPLRENINTFPEALKDSPYQYEGGVDPGTFFNDPKTLPLEVQDIINRGMHEQTLPQQVLEILQTKSPDQVAREKSLPLDVQIILNTPKEPPPHAPWAKPIAGLTMGKAGRQRGALDMSAFTEGFKGLNKWLSKLTDEPWIRQRFPASLYESNQDGTPRVLLHGSSSRFNDTPKAKSLEGFHAGYAGPSHMKASIGVNEHGPTRTYLDQSKLRSGYTSNNLKYKQGEDVPAHVDLGGGAIYPVVIRKGNYPHINKTDLGSFDPSQLQNQTRFLQAVAKASNGRYGFYDVKEIMDNWWASAKSMTDKDMILRSWSRVLKDQFGIDGFYYKNGYESANRKAQLEAERIIARRNYAGLKDPSLRVSRLNELKNKLDPSESFVTWDNNNIRSLYDEPIQPDTSTSTLNRGMGRGQRGGIDLKALGLDLTYSALRSRFTQRLRDSVDYLTRQIKEDFPELAKVLNRPDVKQLVEEIHQSTKESDPIQFWMEKLAGVTSKEDPTLGGQLKPLGKIMTGQAKGPKDMLDLPISEKLRIEEQQFAQIINQLYKQEFDKYSKGKLPSYIENPADGVKWGLEHGYADPIYHDSRMQNKEFAKNYELQTEQIKQYNSFIDKFHQHFSKKYGFDPSHFSELHPEWEQTGDHIWGLIFGLADHLRHDENSFISNRAKGIGRKQGGAVDAKVIKELTDMITKAARVVIDPVGLGKIIADRLKKTTGIEPGRNVIVQGDTSEKQVVKVGVRDRGTVNESNSGPLITGTQPAKGRSGLYQPRNSGSSWEPVVDVKPIDGSGPVTRHTLDEVTLLGSKRNTSSLMNRSTGGKQSGKVDFGGIVDEFNKLADKVKSAITKEGNTPLPKTPEDHLRNLPGMGKEGSAIIAKGRPGEDIVADTHALFDKLQAAGQPIADSKLWENFQSGAGHIAEKLRDIAPWTLELSRWYDYGKRMQQLAVRKYAQPLEKMLIKTSLDEKNQLLIAFKHGMLELGEHVPVEKLLENGMSPKAAKAYSEFIKQFDILLERKNEALRAIGEKELTKQDAYMNSLFHGDWHTFVRDKNGKMLWPVHSPTKAHAELAAKWLREHFKDNPNVDINSLEVKHSPSVKGIPRDYMGAYSKILEYFKDSEVSDQVRAALADYIKQIGSNTLGQEKFHTNVKINARGFEGDKPWLSEKVNANSFLLAQLNYIENGHTWAARQEIMNEAKKVLSDERINKEQPQAVALAKQILMQQMGISQNMLRGVEIALGSKYIPSVALGKDFGISNLKDLSITQGHSAQALPNAVGTLRGAAIFAMLGFSPGYWMATPLQAINGAMGWYSKLKLEGKVKSNPVQFIGDILEGTVSAVTMKHGFSDFAKEYLDWAETNNVAHTIPFDEYRGFTMSMGMRVAKNLTNYTISRPDQLTRIPLSLSLAHAMWRSGAYETKAKAFQEAAELTNQVMIPIRREDRPLGVDKAGVVGDMSYLFASPLVAMWNTIALFGGKMEKNNPKTWLPLLTLLGAMAVMSGIHNMPVVDEAEKTGKYVANIMSEHFPKAYANLADTKWHDWAMFPKETMISNMDDHSFISQITNWGLASALTGVNMSTRFNQGVFDPNDPYGRWSPLTQEPAEWRDATLGVLHNDRHSWANAVHTMSPPLVKGLMETMLPEYKTAIQPDPSTGLTNYRNPNQPRNEDLFVQRNQEETRARMMGVTALSEAQRKSKTLYSLEEQHRRQTAIKKLMPNLWYNAVEGNQKEVVDYATAYEKLDPGGTMMSAFITEHAAKLGMTPEQVIASKAGQSIQSALTAARRARMDQGNATKP